MNSKQTLSRLSAFVVFRCGSSNISLTDRFPRIHFPLATLSPIVPVDRAQHEMNDVNTITNACFQRGSQMINCDPMEGKYSMFHLKMLGGLCLNETLQWHVRYCTVETWFRRTSPPLLPN